LKDWNLFKGSSWPELPYNYNDMKEQLPIEIKQEIDSMFGDSVTVTDLEYKFLEKHLDLYQQTNKQMSKLIDDGFLVTGIPIKLQSLVEKKMLIRNFDKCIQWYNEWVKQNDFGKPYTEKELEQLGYTEEQILNAAVQIQIKSDI
jgi:hypothetical protein